MSIINEALKKAGKEKQSLGTVSLGSIVEDARHNLELEMAGRKPRVNWGPIFVILVLLLITGPIIAPVFSAPFKRMDSAPAVQLASVPARSPDNRKAQFGIEEAPVFAKAIPPPALNRVPDLNLTGIVYSPTDSYCLIDQRVVKVGESVRGAKLISVSAHEARLNYQGKEIALTLSD